LTGNPEQRKGEGGILKWKGFSTFMGAEGGWKVAFINPEV